jgi:hypothetical protein
MKAIVLVTLLATACATEDIDDASDTEADSDPEELDRVVDLITGAADGPVEAGADVDHDGIADAVEEMLIRRYRPYYRFSKAGDADEAFRPANPVLQVTSAQLHTYYTDANGTTGSLAGCGRASDQHLDPPEQLYTCRTDTSWLVSPVKSTYCLNFDNARYAGASWADVQAKATGLYGHVTQAKIDGHAAYKIEYWQFFAFNNQDISILGVDTFGDHEGDWTGLEVWFDRELHRLVKVKYMIHGKSVSFKIPQTPSTCRNCTIDVKGPNFAPNPPNFFDDPRAYDDNQAQFFIDDKGFKHVVAYIERGGHEFWPGAWGHASISVGPASFGLNPHNGEGPAYLVPDITDRVFNLGEVAHPLTRAAKVVLPFNGMWGCTNTKELSILGPVRRSPVGPALHCSWNFPGKGPIAGCSG